MSLGITATVGRRQNLCLFTKQAWLGSSLPTNWADTLDCATQEGNKSTCRSSIPSHNGFRTPCDLHIAPKVPLCIWTGHGSTINFKHSLPVDMYCRVKHEVSQATHSRLILPSVHVIFTIRVWLHVLFFCMFQIGGAKRVPGSSHGPCIPTLENESMHAIFSAKTDTTMGSATSHSPDVMVADVDVCESRQRQTSRCKTWNIPAIGEGREA